MQQFTRYKKDIIAHYHKDNWLSLIKTIQHFWITYKELYKIIDTSRIFNYREVDWIKEKKCSSCSIFKPVTDKYFYTRKWTDTYYSACKICMKLLATAYRIINKKDLYIKRKEYYQEYYRNNKRKIANQKNKYYYRNKQYILEEKRIGYKSSKKQFLKNFLFKLLK